MKGVIKDSAKPEDGSGESLFLGEAGRRASSSPPCFSLLLHKIRTRWYRGLASGQRLWVPGGGGPLTNRWGTFRNLCVFFGNGPILAAEASPYPLVSLGDHLGTRAMRLYLGTK